MDKREYDPNNRMFPILRMARMVQYPYLKIIPDPENNPCLYVKPFSKTSVPIRAIRGLQKTSSIQNVFASFVLRAVPEEGRFNPQRSQIHISLSSVVDLVIDHVHQEPVHGAWPLAESDIFFLEAFGSQVFPDPLKLFGSEVPAVE